MKENPPDIVDDFTLVSPPESVFHRAIDRFYEGEIDTRTLDLLGRR